MIKQSPQAKIVDLGIDWVSGEELILSDLTRSSKLAWFFETDWELLRMFIVELLQIFSF